MGRLIHYSKEPITLRPIDPAIRPNGKPVGLWISAEGDNDWKSWCQDEKFALDNLAYSHEVVLKSDANILLITDPLELDVFTERYSKPCEWSSYRRDIDWLVVAKEYQGIIIAPYCWQRRLSDHTFWYYSWDCASGCIWDVNAIASVSLLSTEQPRCERCEYGLVETEDYYGRPEIFRCPDCGGSGVKEEEES